MKSLFSSPFGYFTLFIFVVLSCAKEESTPGDWITQYNLDKSIVEVNTINVATGLETVFQSAITDSAEQAQLCQAFIEPIRFLNDESGYFFIESYAAWMVAHATNPAVVGTCRMDMQDVNGKYYVRDMVNSILYTGFGFVEYYFNNPANGLTERKIGYVKSIPAAQFFIGSGFYGDPPAVYYSSSQANMKIAEQATFAMAAGIGGAISDYFADSSQCVDFTRQMIDHVRFFDDQSGYFFIYDFNCNNVAHAIQKNLQGQNLYNYQDSKGNYVIRELLAVSQNQAGGGTYEYWWNNPVTGQEEPKLAFVIKIPGIDYFIGSGVYLE
ncbi:MAG: cache domain-containing protein [Bacteroidales bacterium]|nr:cache domain-containing protein [Bacteroidales bacterium]